jgi:hypothetical protein
MPDPFADDPSLIHHVAVDRPGTHVIAIGIGHYDHLPGGGGTPAASPQLAANHSPPRSARKVASWFIEKYDCFEKPLASVSRLLPSRRGHCHEHQDQQALHRSDRTMQDVGMH